NHSTTSDIYWNTIDTRNGFILQSNKVSNIYRVLNNEKQPIFGTSKMREAETYFNRNAKEELIHV
ncbi:MAG: transcriptional regulator, partial [Staphylococcus epidermidis]|nr:transcriptional regulator [Staphylococcus epidermidis]MDU2221626.1 transcriptional regulator [Staphylococcus epidermidis]MDU7023880.1 transcriptional regulator [Staphylococcus epidermidis]